MILPFNKSLADISGRDFDLLTVSELYCVNILKTNTNIEITSSLAEKHYK